MLPGANGNGNGNGSDAPAKPAAFFEGVSSSAPTAAGKGADATIGSYPLPSAGAMGGADHLPSFSEILSSDASVAQKATNLYTVGRARMQERFSSLRPWSEFFDRSYFGSPAGTSDAVNRLNRNISHFYSNYVVLSLACSSYVLLINLTFSLCVLAIVGLYMYVRRRAAQMAEEDDITSDGLIYFGNWGFSPMQLYVMMFVFGIVMFYLLSGSSVIFWLAFTSIGVTCGHAAMRRPPLEENSVFQLA